MRLCLLAEFVVFHISCLCLCCLLKSNCCLKSSLKYINYNTSLNALYNYVIIDTVYVTIIYTSFYRLLIMWFHFFLSDKVIITVSLQIVQNIVPWLYKTSWLCRISLKIVIWYAYTAHERIYIIRHWIELPLLGSSNFSYFLW